jgi:ERCC4-type nuclease
VIPCPFTIYIDTAEQHPFDFVGLKADSAQEYDTYRVSIEKRCLGRHPNSLGDYSLQGGLGRCHIERKSMADLQTTLLGFEDGHRERFRCELKNLSEIEAPLLIVECSKEDFLRQAPQWGKKTAQENAKILYRSIISIEQDFRVQLEWSGSRKMAQQDTFRWMYRFWEKNLKPKRGKKATVNISELALPPELILPGMVTTEQQPQQVTIQSILDTI